MRLITCEADGAVLTGLLSPDETRVGLLQELEFGNPDVNEIITEFDDMELAMLEKLSEDLSNYVYGRDSFKLLAPIPHPKQDIICLGLNYSEHADEAEKFNDQNLTSKNPDYPVYFSKRVNQAVGADEGIQAHEDIVDGLDYEAELGVVIGKDAYNVREEDAEQYIFGYTVCNDVSARNLQSRHTQWYFGKSLDGFTPMGPSIVTAAEIGYPPALRIRSYVNNELRQDSNTGRMLFGIGRVISELSRGMTLQAGTIIMTGTPKGAGMGFNPPKFLKKGDVVTCEIESIGILQNRVI